MTLRSQLFEEIATMWEETMSTETEEKELEAKIEPASGGQSGDTQGLSSAAEAAAESVEGLVESGQGYEAEVVAGVEDSADHPEEPLRPREE
jgi:hypothetical protein